MICPKFVQEVAALITHEPVTTKSLWVKVGREIGSCPLRAVRNALTELHATKQIKRGKPVRSVRTWVRYDTPVQEYRTTDRFLGI
jgi:hypothetical protein